MIPDYNYFAIFTIKSIWKIYAITLIVTLILGPYTNQQLTIAYSIMYAITIAFEIKRTKQKPTNELQIEDVLTQPQYQPKGRFQ